jgi:hypothetical protein
VAGKLKHQSAQRDEHPGKDAKGEHHLDQRDSALGKAVKE